MLRVSLEKTPGCLVLNIAMELSSDLPVVSIRLELQGRLVHSNDIADLTDDRAIFETASIDNDNSEFNVVFANIDSSFVTKGVKSAIDNFKRHEPLAFGALLNWISCINNDAIDVQIVMVLVHRVQGVVLDLLGNKD